MLNIVIPMAGLGSRFASAGYSLPKPLIPVHGISMIELVVRNLTPNTPHRFIFICQEAHCEKYDLEVLLANCSPGSELVVINGITAGAASTVLCARGLIDNDTPLLIANSDQYVSLDINDFIAEVGVLDGLIMTMWADDPKWSFAEVDANRRVSRVVEKEVISNNATVGIYYFKSGKLFVQAADMMIKQELRVNGEFYVAPVYNQIIRDNGDIRIFDVESVGGRMFGLGTPNDLEKFIVDRLI